MKFVKLSVRATADEALLLLRNHEYVNRGVKFDEKYGKPVMKIKDKGERITVTCEMIGGPGKDNGFLVGTFFTGRLKEREGVVTLSGIITTAPLYHLGLLLLTAFFVYQCIRLGGFNPIPVILLAFSYLMFKREFKKQGTIQRYLDRAYRLLGENKKTR